MTSANSLTHCVHIPTCCDFIAHLVASAKEELDRPAHRLRGRNTNFPTSHTLKLRLHAPFLPGVPKNMRPDLSENSNIGVKSRDCRTTHFGRPSQDLTYSAVNRAVPKHLPRMSSSEHLPPGMHRYILENVSSEQWWREALNTDRPPGVPAKRRPARMIRPGRRQAQVPTNALRPHCPSTSLPRGKHSHSLRTRLQ